MNCARILAVFASLLLFPALASAQTWPADAAWAPLERGGAPVEDVEGDVMGSRDIVGDAANPAAYLSADGTFLFFRIRLDETPLDTQGTDLRPFAWGVEFDTDGDTSDFEALAMVNGIANPSVVSLQENTVQGTVGDPSDTAEVEIATYPFATHVRVADATSMFSQNGDFFLDFAVPWSDLATVGIVPGGSFGIILGSGNSANAFAADIGTVIADEVSDPNTCSANGCNLPAGQFVISITTPAGGAVLPSARPTVSGTSSEANTTLTITIDEGTAAEQTGMATTDANGNWTFTPTTPLADGAHTIKVEGMANNMSASDTVSFTVDTTLLGVTVDVPAAGGLTNDSTPTFSGTTRPGATVTVTVGGMSYMTTADANGDWTLDTGDALTDGEQTATVGATEGNETAADVMVTFTVDTMSPALTIDAPADGGTVDPNVTVSGTAEAGSTVEISVDGVVAGTVTADADGNWEFDLTNLPGGDAMIAATATDAAGNESTEAVSVTVTDDMPANNTPGNNTPGNNGTNNNAGPDSDGDGLSDEIEALIGTDPDVADTDGDGLSDGDEFNDYKSNPLDVDTDKDGLEDGEEVELGTDPRVPDTDGGGVGDGVEVERGSDPLEASDDFGGEYVLAGDGCSSMAAAGPNSGWLLLVALLFKRRRRL